MSIVSTRAIIYIVSMLLVTGSIGGAIYTWHYKPLKALTKRVKALEETVVAKDRTIHNLGVQITRLIADNKVSGFEEYFEGGGGVEVNPYDGNIFLKRVQ